MSLLSTSATQQHSELLTPPSRPGLHGRSQSQHSPFAKSAIMSTITSAPRPQSMSADGAPSPQVPAANSHLQQARSELLAPASSMKHTTLQPKQSTDSIDSFTKPLPTHRQQMALNDTPATTAPSSPQIPPKRQDSAEKVNRLRPTTLDIPGLTKSAVSPDGRIAQRDIGSKLVIIMVGLPARGKSYITKKLTRYMNWLQHDTMIFNVGERRRVAAGGGHRRSHSEGVDSPASPESARKQSSGGAAINGAINRQAPMDDPTTAAKLLLHGPGDIPNEPSQSQTERLQNGATVPNIPELKLPEAGEEENDDAEATKLPEPEPMDQSAAFFDPENEKAKKIREQCALDSLDDLLDYILNKGGAVGILDATNSTIERRQVLMKHIRDKAGPYINVLFVESVCIDENLLERNMRLKLSGPDYKDKDPVSSLLDFKKRVGMYERSYIPLGEYEERNNMAYVQMIDVGRKVICHQIKGFLSTQAVNYLLNFNLAPRQIWITRHGESEDNKDGKIGGNSALTPYGRQYAQALAKFLAHERKAWEIHEINKKTQANLSPFPGDTTPPNPHYAPDGDEDHIIEKSFCVWTSMLKRSIETAQYFDEEDFDIKQMKMLDEINAGYYEGMTYGQIKANHRAEFDMRRLNKLHYRYPGPGGEGYLDVINRLRPVIVELERMTDHVLLIGHRSIARILLAYFMGLGREEVTHLDVPIGMLYCLEPKPYGVYLKAYRYDGASNEFVFEPDYKLHPAASFEE